MMFEDDWYPVALSRDIEASSSAGTRLFGQELVVWRDTDGHARVWEDRCPHRGMRLSFGFVRGNHIACLYHGWQYDTEGQCRYIPAHPQIEVPKSIRVNRYQSHEGGGLIWVYSGAPETAPGLSLTFESIPVRSITIDCAADVLLQALPAELSGPLSGYGIAEISRLGSVVTAKAGAVSLVLGVQPMDTRTAALHIALSAPDPERLETRMALTLWSERLRDRVEGNARSSTGRGHIALGGAVP